MLGLTPLKKIQFNVPDDLAGKVAELLEQPRANSLMRGCNSHIFMGLPNSLSTEILPRYLRECGYWISHWYVVHITDSLQENNAGTLYVPRTVIANPNTFYNEVMLPLRAFVGSKNDN